MMVRPGNIMKPVTNFDGSAARDDELLLCVANLKWGLLTWPLTAIGDSEMILCPYGDMSWTFLTRLLFSPDGFGKLLTTNLSGNHCD